MADWPQGNADLDYDHFSPLVVNMPNNGYYGFQGVTAYTVASTCTPQPLVGTSMPSPQMTNSLLAEAYMNGRRAAEAEFSALQQPLKGSPPPALERPAVGKRMFRFRALKESSPAAE